MMLGTLLLILAIVLIAAGIATGTYLAIIAGACIAAAVVLAEVLGR